ncbi:hypothetical protein GG344DRAFT_69244 [Lentinula edodes]|nr:hypothetical protein GG344DRAFT_69244 [Lentinula edodes]
MPMLSKSGLGDQIYSATASHIASGLNLKVKEHKEFEQETRRSDISDLSLWKFLIIWLLFPIVGIKNVRKLLCVAYGKNSRGKKRKVQVGIIQNRSLMEPDNTTDSETGNPTHTGWWRRQTYDYCSYYLDSDGMIQKIYHSPDAEESRTRGRAKTPPLQKGALKKTETPSFAKDANRGSTPVSFKPQARPPKYFLQGGLRTSNVTNDTYGPTKLETNRFRSHDSEGETAWHSSQSPNDLDAPPPETATPRLLGTIYVHRNTTDGGYQIWVWCSHEGTEQEFWWRPVDLENEQFAHPKITTRSLKLTSGGKPSWVLNSTLTTYRTRSVKRSRSRPATGSTLGSTESRASKFPMHSWRDDDKDFQLQNTSSSSTPRPTTTDIEDLIIGLTTSASISSTTDTRILGKMDPASTPKPTTCAIDSQIPESTENVSMLLSPEALFGQMVFIYLAKTTEPIMSGIEDQIPTKASSPLTTDTPMENLASSPPGHTMDNLDTRGKDNSASPSEGCGCPTDESSRLSEGPGHPSEESGPPSGGPERPKWFQNIVAGALIYLLFLIRVLQKIYAMFWSQPLAVAVGNLTLSIVVFILIQYHPPMPVQLKVTKEVSVTR